MAAKKMRGKTKKICPNFSDLPRDVTISIFLRLPCKAILCCKVACKEWFNIVTSDPIFAKIHYKNNSMALLCPKAILYGYKKKTMNKRGWLYKLDPFRLHGCSWDEFHVVNSCKGFLLMVGGHSEAVGMVYNPLTNETVDLPNLESGLSYDRKYVCWCGLGFSPVTKRFKVVVCVCNFRRKKMICRVLIHTLGDNTTGAWRGVSLRECQCLILKNTLHNPIELNGVLHWQTEEDRIVCFDVEKEEVGEIWSTPSIGESEKHLSSIGVYRGLLCLGIVVFGNPDRLEMWGMIEYGIKESWMRFLVVEEALAIKSIYSPKLNFDCEYPKLIDILDTGEIIFLSPEDFQSKSYHIFSYDPIDECFQKLPLPKDYSEMIIDVYIPSFFSLKQLQE